MKKCIYCNTHLTKKNKSKEHVFPQWLLNRINPEFPNTTGKHTSFPNIQEIIHSERTIPRTSFVLGTVCVECNTNWMSKLENDCKSLLLALIDDRSPIILTKDQCLILTKWFLKTALNYNYAVDYKKIIPLEHAHFLYSQNDIPANVKVDVAFCKDVNIRQLIGGNKKAILPNEYENKREMINKSYFVTFQFDHTLIRLSWTPDSKIQFRNIPASSIYRIYPMKEEEIVIQVIRGRTFRDIDQFHFVSSVIIEDSIAERMTLDLKDE